MEALPPLQPTGWTQTTWVGLAMAGGVVRYLDVYLKGGAVPKIGLTLANAGVSGFCGFMAASIMLKVQPDWALMTAGVAGYIGTQVLDWMADAIRKKLTDDSKEPPRG